MVVLGRDDDDAVGLRNRLRRAGYDRRELFFLQVMIVERKLAD